MNSDTESLQNQLLAWLLAEDATTEEDFLVESKEINGANSNSANTASTSGASESEDMLYPFQLGEIPAVQTRFQTELANSDARKSFSTIVDKVSRITHFSRTIGSKTGWGCREFIP